ncbi:MAG: tripartite tricarboxylate transporter TctB family protein [Candidatus Puniceispirillaceae bacterium]
MIMVDRLSGMIVLLVALAMIFVVIPAHVETAEGGVIQPATFPYALCWLLAACGAWLLVIPGTQEGPADRGEDRDGHDVEGVADRGGHDAPSLVQYVQYGRASVHVALLAAGVAAMGRFGFIVVAPFLALAIMLLIGERRPGWLALGAGAVPAMVWVFVVQILGRPLL